MDALSRIFFPLKGASLRGWLLLVLLAAVGSLAGGCGGIAGGLAASAATGAIAGSAFAPNPYAWPFEEKSRVLALDCGGRRVVLEFSEFRAWLFLPEETVQLKRIVSEPLQYGTGHWDAGDPVSVQVSGQPGDFVYDTQVFVAVDRDARAESVILQESEVQVACSVDRRETPFETAKLAGADFRGLGNEPGWELVIWWDRMRLTYDYGEAQLEVALEAEPETTADGKGSRFRGQAGGKHLEVLLQLGPCQDSMSDQEFETRVSIDLDGRGFEGCGKALH